MGNQCSGGLSKGNNKGFRIQTLESAEWEYHGVPVLSVLPTELWKAVLIYANTENFSVGHARTVKSRTEIAENDLISSSSYLLTPDNITGIRISNMENSEMCTKKFGFRLPNADPSTSPQPPYNIFYGKFFELSISSGEHIYSVEYSVRDDVPESIEGLWDILEMNNLRCLSLHSKDWSMNNVSNGLLRMRPEILSTIFWGEENRYLVSLENFQITGSNGFLPLNYLFKFFGHQITSLFVYFRRNDYLQKDYHIRPGLIYSLAELTPNVKILKIYDVNENILSKIMPDWGLLTENEGKLRHLEHLTVKLQIPYIRTLFKLCKAIDEHCAETIQTLNLKISGKPKQYFFKNIESDRCTIVDIDPTVKLKKLKQLDISFVLFLQQPDFLFTFSNKCPNLKRISFTSYNVHSSNFPDLKGFCSPLWCKLSGRVEKISINYWISPHEIKIGGENVASLRGRTEPVLVQQTVVRPEQELQWRFPGDGGTGTKYDPTDQARHG